MKNNALFHPADVLSFQNFFKTWLLDCGTDQEHLRLSLPGAFNQNNESKFKNAKLRRSIFVVSSKVVFIIRVQSSSAFSHRVIMSYSATSSISLLNPKEQQANLNNLF